MRQKPILFVLIPLCIVLIIALAIAISQLSVANTTVNTQTATIGTMTAQLSAPKLLDAPYLVHPNDGLSTGNVAEANLQWQW